MSLARVGDKVLIFNQSEDDCPSQVQGYIVDGAQSVFGGGALFALLGSKVQLSCAQCGPAQVIEASKTVFAEGLGVHRALGDKVMARCGQGYTLDGEPTILVGD